MAQLKWLTGSVLAFALALVFLLGATALPTAERVALVFFCGSFALWAASGPR
ncbi:MAG TPA: hypothetical protein VGN26_23120 [Armatimonadota bacterium]